MIGSPAKRTVFAAWENKTLTGLCAPDRGRTYDLPLRKRTLYPLSYRRLVVILYIEIYYIAEEYLHSISHAQGKHSLFNIYFSPQKNKINSHKNTHNSSQIKLRDKLTI